MWESTYNQSIFNRDDEFAGIRNWYEEMKEKNMVLMQTIEEIKEWELILKSELDKKDAKVTKMKKRISKMEKEVDNLML